MASSGSTPERHHDNSGAANSDAPSNSKASVRKDRACPFCHQPFTSSSLGRHLDFFIRDKNPKPPDGIHDVHQIRKLRENITRRHTRIPSGTVVDNSSRRWSVTSIASPKSASRSHTAASIPQKLAINPNQYVDHKWAAAKNWTATGVINNLPPRGPPTPLPRILPRPDAYKSQTPSSYANLEEIDDARAAELALKDVLGLIRNAASTLRDTPLFDFDFYAYNFPALCLRILSPPAALFSTTPLATPDSWPLSLPNESHLSSIQHHLIKRISQVQVDINKTGPLNADGHMARPMQMHQYHQSEFRPYFDHMEGVYQQWQSLSEPQRMEIWRLETLRAYAQEREHKHEVQLRLDNLQTDNQRLCIQLEEFRARQHNWQQTGSADLTPPPLPKTITQSLISHGVDLRDWDYEKLIAKYRPKVQKTRRQSATNGASNDLRNAHERALLGFAPPGGPPPSLLLRPIVGQQQSSPETLADGEAETPHGRGGGGSRRESESGGESRDGDGEVEDEVDVEGDEDVDMEDGVEGQHGGQQDNVRAFGRQGAG